MNKISVCSWNILSPHYCNKNTFSKTEEKYLKFNYRINLIKEKLDYLIKYKNTNIFMLQEVSDSFSNKLIPYFENNNFKYVLKNYSNNKMGVMIAYNNDFKLEEINSIRIGSMVEKQSIPEFTFFGYIINYLKKFLKPINNLLLFFRINLLKSFLNKSPQKDAMDRNNILLLLKLKYNTKSLWLANYHMPCSFKRRLVQKIHLEKCFNVFKNKQPLIFGGDFNICYESYLYFYLQKYNFIDCIDNNLPTLNTYASWNGYFKGSLDYIFLRENNYIKAINSDKELIEDKIMPNDKYPSDHGWIFSSFSFIN